MLYRQYLTVDKNSTERQEIKFSIFYEKGRGYKVSSYPVTRFILDKSKGLITERMEAYTGFNDILIICPRQSQKQLNAAIAELNRPERKQKYFDWYKERYNWTLENISDTTDKKLFENDKECKDFS